MNIKNFAIIAHIDHGKSTLADRFLEICKVVKAGSHEEQLLDRNPISRERGITIKLAPVTMNYEVRIMNNEKHQETPIIHNSKLYILNLIDTPGHVDFSYEVDRTLSCVEGVVLLVDATAGIQAQTIANAYKAIEKNLVIIPAINKVDLPSAQVEKTKKQIVDFLGIPQEEIFEISAKTGVGVETLLKAVIEKVPSPSMIPGDSLQALVFDSYYDTHRGVIAFIRVFEGTLQSGKKVRLLAQNVNFETKEVGTFKPELKPKNNLQGGEIGYVVTNLKDIHMVRVGDTLTDSTKTAAGALAGYKKVQPMVYASVFPTDPDEYLRLKNALEKLYLTDSALEYTAIYSQALGAGYRVGFLGLLHADVTRARLEREYDLNLILTPPQVEYKREEHDGLYLEPYVKILIVTPQEYVGAAMQLSEDHRATFLTMDNKNQVSLSYEMPMSELIGDFFDSLKRVSSGYASLDWEFLRYQKTKADKLMILLNEDEIKEFSEVVVEERSLERGRYLTKTLKDAIPRQQFEIKIQAKYKGKIIASEKISAFRKDVTSGLYGGDRTRKDKLLKKQKEGKKKMKMVGRVEIPKEAFLKMFRKES